MTPTLGGAAARRAALGSLLALGGPLAVVAGSAPSAAATLIQSCPYTIIAPGTYVLARDLTCPGTAITVAADNARLDLGGRTLAGGGESGVGVLAEGTGANPTVEGLRVANGTVAGFDGGVIVIAAPGARVAGVTARDNENAGISVVDSPDARVAGNTASSNGIVGIVVFDSAGARVEGNTVSGNAGFGLVADDSDGSRLAGNRTDDNGNVGLLLFDTRDARVEGNAANGNGEDGVDIDGPGNGGNLVRGNTANGNGRAGIGVDEGSTGNRLEGNRATGNAGVDLRDDNLPTDPPGACPNAWRGNRFATDNEGDGPTAGCIR